MTDAEKRIAALEGQVRELQTAISVMKIIFKELGLANLDDLIEKTYQKLFAERP